MQLRACNWNIPRTISIIWSSNEFYLSYWKFTFVKESIDSSYRGGLVVAPQHEYFILEFDLIREEKTNSLNPLFSSVDIIAQE